MGSKQDYLTLKEYSESLEDELAANTRMDLIAFVTIALVGALVGAGTVMLWGYL